MREQASSGKRSSPASGYPSLSYPERSQFDLVGIDNRRAGYTITAHLLGCGCRRVMFLGRAGSAPTVDARIAGYCEALEQASGEREPIVCRINPEEKEQVKAALAKAHPDGIVCANDFTAAQLLKTLTELGVAVPAKMRLAGIDDVKYASLVSVPLTTIHQPCTQIGATAVQAMIQRIENPTMPSRDIFVNFHLVVRQSSGAGNGSKS